MLYLHVRRPSAPHGRLSVVRLTLLLVGTEPSLVQYFGSKLLEAAAFVRDAGFHVDHAKVQQALQLVLESLPKVSELAIELWKVPVVHQLNNLSGPQALSADEVQGLARNVYSSLALSLHTLVLTGMPDSLAQLIEPLLDSKATMEMSNLRRLELHIVHDPGSTTRPWSEIVAPFVNSFGPHLEELRVVSYPAISLSGFFNALGNFPCLRTIHVYAPFNAAFQHDAQGFIRFLHRHASTLQTLTLRLNPNRSALNSDAEASLSNCLDHDLFVQDVPFCGLRQLTIYPTRLQAGQDAVTRCLQVSGRLLTSLAVRDSYYTQAQVDDLVSALPHGGATLRRLRMNVLILNGTLLDLLSVKTAFIVELTISSMVYGVGDEDSPVSLSLYWVSSFSFLPAYALRHTSSTSYRKEVTMVGRYIQLI